jgi:hypothetical protein
VFDKGLKKISERIDKHMCKEAELAEPMWQRATGKLIELFASYEDLAKRCYESTTEVPTADKIRGACVRIRPPQ